MAARSRDANNDSALTDQSTSRVRSEQTNTGRANITSKWLGPRKPAYVAVELRTPRDRAGSNSGAANASPSTSIDDA